ncbi:hypothetical protein BAUCODRAFT_35104 [Baudoinia panamericana UAMH 10762]|uniref:Uncharacterized protein n=1 Tax=Baudoinia panamericana (strain UAMH 10762) TaxID=717646 RepID=M2LLF7_BAUPA|nr:uncharacterized protein BAUCODRAFT_35104 [Baudoinia panamericana UAMH 10762]EMC95112.1 hypothetical protein BAUCODRAFT_35104 [Baudoinia panamericana UAMH 10762]
MQHQANGLLSVQLPRPAQYWKARTTDSGSLVWDDPAARYAPGGTTTVIATDLLRTQTGSPRKPAVTNIRLSSTTSRRHHPE